MTNNKPPYFPGTLPGFDRRLADAFVAANAPSTVRAYTADWKHFPAWCLERSIQAIPAEPALVGE